MRRWNKVIFLGVTCLALAGCGKDRGDELAKDYQKNDELASDTSADADITGHLTYELISDSGITIHGGCRCDRRWKACRKSLLWGKTCGSG